MTGNPNTNKGPLEIERPFAYFELLLDDARLNNQRNAILGNVNSNQRTIVDGAGQQEVRQFVVDLLLH
jgi:hypothetical protein